MMLAELMHRRATIETGRGPACGRRCGAGLRLIATAEKFLQLVKGKK